LYELWCCCKGTPVPVMSTLGLGPTQILPCSDHQFSFYRSRVSASPSWLHLVQKWECVKLYTPTAFIRLHDVTRRQLYLFPPLTAIPIALTVEAKVWRNRCCQWEPHWYPPSRLKEPRELPFRIACSCQSLNRSKTFYRWADLSCDILMYFV
jgi:hypothetical protein